MVIQEAMARFWLGLEKTLCGLTSLTAQVGNLSMPYLVGGHGPNLVLIHGFGGDRYNFTRVAARLRKRFRVYIPDLPGFGEASHFEETGYDIRSQADHVAAFMHSLGIASAHVGGNSMGGLIAAELAIQHPTLVESLWLMNALGCPAALNSEMYRDFRRTGKLPLIIRSVEDFEYALTIVSAKKIMFPGSLKQRYLSRALRSADLHEKIAQHLSAESSDLIARNVRIDHPTLIVWGSEDRILSPSCIPEQQHVFRNHVIKVMQGIGHVPMMEDPKNAVLDYLNFFDGISKPQ